MARGVNLEDWTTPEALDELRGIAKLTLQEIATYMGISTSTLRRWRLQSDELDEAVLQKTDKEDRMKIQEELKKSCFEHKKKLKSKKQVLDREGQVHTLEEEKEVLVPADVRAQKFYLTNRYPARWKEKVTIEDESAKDILSFIPVSDRMDQPEEEASEDG